MTLAFFFLFFSSFPVGITLEGENASFTWDVDALQAGGDEADNNGYSGEPTHKLLIRQILLGAAAAEGEMNVIEVETITVKDKLKIPIAVLKVGETRHLKVELDFPDSPVTFRLTQGKGPVHLLGQHLEQLQEEEMNMEEYEEEDDDDEVSDSEDVPPSKLEDGGPTNAKRLKLAAAAASNNHKKAKSDKGKKSAAE